MTNDLRYNCMCPADHYWYVGDVPTPACCSDETCAEGSAAEMLCPGWEPACCSDVDVECSSDDAVMCMDYVAPCCYEYLFDEGAEMCAEGTPDFDTCLVGEAACCTEMDGCEADTPEAYTCADFDPFAVVDVPAACCADYTCDVAGDEIATCTADDAPACCADDMCASDVSGEAA
jgi:hypothetical protein